jgi:hypothetical protein
LSHRVAAFEGAVATVPFDNVIESAETITLSPQLIWLSPRTAVRRAGR